MANWTSLGVDPEAAEAARLKAVEEEAAAPPVTAPEPAAAAPPQQLATPAQTTPQWQSVPKQGQVVPGTIRKAPSPDASVADRAIDVGKYYGEGGLLAADSGTFGVGNRLIAAARAGGNAYGQGGSYGDHYNRTVAGQNQYLQKLRDEDPARAVAADVAGGAAIGGPGLAKLGITVAKPGVGWIERAVRGVGEGTIQGTAQGVGSSYGGFQDKAISGGMGGIFGSAVGGGVPLAGSGVVGAAGGVRKVLGNAVGAADNSIPIPVLRAAENERRALERLPIEQGGRLTDPPSLTRLGQGVHTENSPGVVSMEDMLRRRDAATADRLRDARHRILGETIEPAEFAAANRAAREQLRPEYDAAYGQARDVNVEGVARWLEGQSVGKRGEAQEAAKKIRKALDITDTTILDTDPRTLHATREMIDDMLYPANGTPPPPGVQRVLTQARERITTELHDKVPGIANVDAKYAEIASRQDAYDYGRNALDGGKEAIPPRTFAANDAQLGRPKGTDASEVAGPSAAPLASREGTKYDIDRLLGTTSNDLQQLKTLFKERFNVEKFETQYGSQARQAMQDAIDNNLTFREAYQKIVHGSKTADTLAAAKETGSLPKLTLRDAASDIYNRFQAGTQSQQRNRIAEILATEEGLPALRDRILAEAADQRRRDVARTMVDRGITAGGSAAGPRYIEIRPGRRN